MQIQDSQQTHFERIGGADKVLQLVTRFYDIMEVDPAASEVLALHPSDLTRARERLYEFLVGWMGGPPLYMDKYGHPRLRMRHMHVAIGEQARDEWMYCIEKAMAELNIDSALQKDLQGAFYKVADFMRNTAG